MNLYTIKLKNGRRVQVSGHNRDRALRNATVEFGDEFFPETLEIYTPLVVEYVENGRDVYCQYCDGSELLAVRCATPEAAMETAAKLNAKLESMRE